MTFEKAEVALLIARVHAVQHYVGGCIAGVDESASVAAGEGLHAFFASQYVVRECTSGIKQFIEFIVDSVCRGVGVGVDFLDDHISFAFYFCGREGGVFL